MSENVLARSWDEAAAGYDAYFTPRFRPGIEAAQGEVIAHGSDLRPGDGRAPCCGPASDLAGLSPQPGRRTVRAFDSTAGMTELARRNLDKHGVAAELSVRDCRDLSSDYAGRAAALISCFG